MIYKVKTNITGPSNNYHPGDILGDEFSEEEIERFCSCRAVCPVGAKLVVSESDTNDDDEISTDDEADKIDMLSEEELKKLSSKKAIMQYAESIGMEPMEESMTRPEMIDKVLAYQEEVFR